MENIPAHLTREQYYRRGEAALGFQRGRILTQKDWDLFRAFDEIFEKRIKPLTQSSVADNLVTL